jgi:glycosyltransferase domain-containing protein
LEIIVLDSTPQELPQNELLVELKSENVIWKRYDKEIRIVDKIADGFNSVKTKYSVLCADDDFLIPPSLVKCIEFLNANPDYSSCQGIYFQHRNAAETSKNRFSLGRLYQNACSLESNSGTKRFNETYIENKVGITMFYAVHRTDIQRSIWNESQKYSLSRSYTELFPNIASCISGKMKFLPIFYSSREPNNRLVYHTANKEINLEMHSEENTKKLFLGLSKYMSKVDGIPLKKSRSILEQFNPLPTSLRPGYKESQEEQGREINGNFFHKVLTVAYKLEFKKKLFTILCRLFLLIVRQGCPREIYKNDFNDFKRIKNAVLSAGLTYEQLNEARILTRKHYLN